MNDFAIAAYLHIGIKILIISRINPARSFVFPGAWIEPVEFDFSTMVKSAL
jgi:hypothetical protein